MKDNPRVAAKQNGDEQQDPDRPLRHGVTSNLQSPLSMLARAATPRAALPDTFPTFPGWVGERRDFAAKPAFPPSGTFCLGPSRRPETREKAPEALLARDRGRSMARVRQKTVYPLARVTPYCRNLGADASRQRGADRAHDMMRERRQGTATLSPE